MKIFLSLCMLLFISISCDTKKEQELKMREAAIRAKEIELAEKEADYNSLLAMRDSLIAVKKQTNDTLTGYFTLPDSLKISWNSKMICRESNCGAYVIGDQRTEVWKFMSDSTGSYANVINNNQLVRTYAVKFNRNKIVLDFAADSISKSKAKIDIVLDDLSKDIIRGTQTITGEQDCTTLFSVELTPSQKK